MIKKGKVTIIGAGLVGSTTAFALMHSSVVSEIVLIDINKEKAEGDILDMSHGMTFIKPIKLTAGDYSDTAGSELVIITAGANQKEGETRLDLMRKNTKIFTQIVGDLKKYITEESIILVVTNPVDILTYLTYKLSGFPKSKVIGSGTVLDTARLRFMIGQQMHVDTRNVHAYIIGEHGDSEVAAWSGATVGMMSMDEYCNEISVCCEFDKNEIYEEVKNAAYKIIEKKGATYYAIAMGVRRIAECILRDENSILTISTLLSGEYGISDICLSVPTLLGGSGAGRVLEIPLSPEESARLTDSARLLKAHADEVGI